MGTLHKEKYIFLITSRLILPILEMSSTKGVEKIKIRILFSMTFFFFRKSCHLWDRVEKYGRATQATDDNMEHAHCMLDT
jgi:hypothetical protein